MFGSSLQLTPGTAAKFLKQYEEDVIELKKLQENYRDAVEADVFSSGTGTVKDAVDAYAAQNNRLLEAHEAVQKKVEAMEKKYVEFGIPEQAAKGYVKDQSAFLHNLEVIKRQAIDQSKIEDDAQTSLDPTIKNEHARLRNFAEGSSKDRNKAMTFLEDKQIQNPVDSLSLFYAWMWETTYQRDRLYAERKHRLAYEGEGSQSQYDIRTKSGYNLRYGEWNTQSIGIDGELGYLARMNAEAGGLFSVVRLGGMSNLGKFKVERVEYTGPGDKEPLVDLNGNVVRGPAQNLIIQEVSMHGGFSLAYKLMFASNDEMRVMQAGYALGSLLSSHVNNSAVLLDVEAIKKDPNISEEHRQKLLDAQADAKKRAEEFMEKGITLNSLTPGYGGMDFFLQQEAIAEAMGIPFNPKGPTLEELLMKQEEGSQFKMHLPKSATLCTERLRTRCVTMRRIAREKLEKSTMQTEEYKSLLSFTTASNLVAKYKGYEHSTDAKEKELYDKYMEMEKFFKKTHSHITDPEAYAKAFAHEMEHRFGEDFNATKKALEDRKSPGFRELIKNAVGARFTGREDWYRRLKHLPKPNVTMDNKNDADGKVTATNAGDPTKPLVLGKGADPRDVMDAALKIGGGTTEENHEKDLKALEIEGSGDPSLVVRGSGPTKRPRPDDSGVGVAGAPPKKPDIAKQEPADESIDVVADVGASKKTATPTVADPTKSPTSPKPT